MQFPRMRKILFLSLVAWFSVTLIGCDHKAERLLEHAEAYLPSLPDSAEVCLDSIKQPQRLNDAQKAWYGLLRTYVDNRQGKGVGSDSLIRDSYDYYHRTSHAGQTSDMTLLRRYAQSCYYMALFYSSCDSTKQCEDLLHQAIKGSEKCEDWHTCYLAYTILGKSTSWSNPEYATQQSLKALDIYHKINDDVNNEVLILAHIAASHLALAEPDSALKYYIKSCALAEKNHLEKSQNEAYMGMACTYRYMGEDKKALRYAKRSVTTADGEFLVSSLLNLAECYYESDSLDQAKKVLSTIPCDSDDYIGQYLILRGLSDIAIRQQNLDSLSAYVDSAYECLENRFYHIQSVKDEYYQENLAKELEKERIQHEAERNKWIGGGIILVMTIFASFIIYNVLRHKKRAVAEHQKEIQHQKELLHQKSMTIAVLQKHLLEKLEHAQKLLTDNEKVHMTEEAWREMEHLINDTDNNFVQKLRKEHKEFKEEDIQLCMIVHLKVPNATIAKIFHIGESAVKKRKLNLKKNGFKVTDSTISLVDVIDNI